MIPAHDIRRSGIRDMVLAGIPQSVAMAISGHRTVSVFNRYAIASPDDMQDAIERTQAYRDSLESESPWFALVPGLGVEPR